MNKISGSEYPLKDVFSDKFDFIIPPYQRPYSWTIEEAGQLFDDLFDFMTTQNMDETYFLGSIVLIKEESNAHSEIIDGQQRLTTLTILLATLASHVDESTAQLFWKYINEPGNPIEGLEAKPRLKIREKDNCFFKRYIQEKRIEELLNNSSSLNEVETNIRENCKLFNQRLSELRDEDPELIVSLGKFIVNRCFLVTVSTPTMNSAYRIFTVLNNRGLDLSNSDLLKADVIGSIEEVKQEEYTKKWEDIEEKLSIRSFESLFSHIRMVYLKAKVKSTILEEVRNNILALFEDKKKFIDELLIPFSEAYLKILNDDFKSEKTRNYVTWLKGIDNSDWIPVALSFMVNKPEEHYEEFFYNLEIVSAGVFYRRLYINERIEKYSKILKTIEKGEDLFGYTSPLVFTKDEKRKFLDKLDSDIYNVTRIKKYVLEKVDSLLSTSGLKHNHRVVTVEHVLPQTLPESGEWSSWDDDLHNKWVHKLGNLVLLSRYKNGLAKNYGFDKKKDVYFRTSDGVSNFALTTTVIQEDEWTPTVVEKRQEELLLKLKDYYRLHQN